MITGAIRDALDSLGVEEGEKVGEVVGYTDEGTDEWRWAWSGGNGIDEGAVGHLAACVRAALEERRG